MLKNKKILITSGPTWVPIDAMRVISNRSTGELGHILTRSLQDKGARITLVEGPVTHRAELKSIEVIKFHFYDELRKILRRELKKPYDAVIHLAAVSDYQLKKVHTTKLRSDLSDLTLHLVPTKKLIGEIKKLNPNALLVGFKLESNISEKKLKEKASKLFWNAYCDLVVANCLDGKKYAAYIFDRSENILARGNARGEIAKKLTQILDQRL